MKIGWWWLWWWWRWWWLYRMNGKKCLAHTPTHKHTKQQNACMHTTDPITETSAARGSVRESLTPRKKRVVVGSWWQLARWWHVRLGRREKRGGDRWKRAVRAVRNCTYKIWMSVWDAGEDVELRHDTYGDGRTRGHRHLASPLNSGENSSLIYGRLYVSLSLSLPGGNKEPVSHASCPADCLPNHYSLTFRQREEGGQRPVIL